jgi:hypothetical protein
MPAAMLVIDFRSGLDGHARSTHLFNSGDDARAAQERVAAAAKAYHDRANDREQMFTFETASGPSTVDVSVIMGVGVDDSLGRGKAAVDEWNTGIEALKGRGLAAKRAAASGIAAQRDETRNAAQPEGQEPGPEGETPNLEVPTTPEPVREEGHD